MQLFDSWAERVLENDLHYSLLVEKKEFQYWTKYIIFEYLFSTFINEADGATLGV